MQLHNRKGFVTKVTKVTFGFLEKVTLCFFILSKVTKVTKVTRETRPTFSNPSYGG